MAQWKVATVKTNNNQPIANKEAANVEDVYNEICNLVSEMRIVAARQTDAEHMRKISDLFGCEPPCFGQDTDPLLAKHWVFGLETIFDCLGCSDEQKVSFAVLRLKDAALSWWRVTKRRLEADGVSVTWEKFKELFYERYFSRRMKREKYTELCNLEQGDRSVAEYDEEFIKLSSLVSDFILDDASEANLFVRGLRPEISRKLFFLDDTSYTRVRDMALMLEQRLNAQVD